MVRAGFLHSISIVGMMPVDRRFSKAVKVFQTGKVLLVLVYEKDTEKL